MQGFDMETVLVKQEPLPPPPDHDVAQDPFPPPPAADQSEPPKKKPRPSSVKHESPAPNIKKPKSREGSTLSSSPAPESSGPSRPRKPAKKATKKKKLDAPATPQGDESEDDDQLYCICKTRYDADNNMVLCDKCEQWYHFTCMGIKEDENDLLDMFVCPPCEAVTSDRTTWHVKCRRARCKQPAKTPLSGYCSERCGVMAVAERMSTLKLGKSMGKLAEDNRVRTATKLEGLITWNKADGQQDWLARFEARRIAKLASGMSVAEGSRFRREVQAGGSEELGHAQARISALSIRKARISASLDLLDARVKLLHLVGDRLSTLPSDANGVDEEEPEPAEVSKKKKKKSAVRSDTPGPRCGYDERLHWDDAAFSAWLAEPTHEQMLDGELPLDGTLDDQPPTGQPSICATPKRRCKRHADWSNMREGDLDVESRNLSSSLVKLEDQEQAIRKTIAELLQKQEVASKMETEREQREKMVRERKDQAAAMELANEGTRRAPLVGR